MAPFPLFSKYKQKLPFCHTFCPPENVKKEVKKEDFNRHEFSTNKQYEKIKLMQN